MKGFKMKLTVTQSSCSLSVSPQKFVKGNTYIVNIAIKGIIPGEAWWYIACEKLAEELIGVPALTLVASV
ncbi:hypothetical protein E2562_015612 [Oryza meyeriana var. granulata]|uniref:Uncharacterized protein n=1 Tax=Oryza meyeriana var. granulata TaxID=110450 RepID=A0A6G1EK64_9ORYZ|nr:hypothetical protein E2562_015612 [Oryza meyeriana var. granulata]